MDKLHGDGQQWVPIVDPGILIDPGYPAYDEGLKDDVFIKDASGQPYHGQVGLPHLQRILLKAFVMRLTFHAMLDAVELQWQGRDVEWVNLTSCSAQHSPQRRLLQST